MSGINKKRSARWARIGKRKILLIGKMIAPIQSKKPSHPATERVLHKLIARTNRLSGKIGPVANNKRFELTGYFANS